MTAVMPYLFPVMVSITLGNTLAMLWHRGRTAAKRREIQERIEEYDRRISALEKRRDRARVASSHRALPSTLPHGAAPDSWRHA